MLVSAECPLCGGLGETEQGPDAWDSCPKCLGAGVLDYDPADEIEDWMETNDA